MVIVVYLLPKTIEPSYVSINQVNVNDKIISINADVNSSAIKYKKYTSEVKDNKLYIKIKGSAFSNNSGKIIIEIDNNNYAEIYIQGKSESKKIWPE